jgi:CubicO group peptidase (beta-lactamase class C family)
VEQLRGKIFLGDLQKKEYDNYISPVTILNLVYKLPLSFTPGENYEYSNTNYTLLGILIERITNHSAIYEVKKRIINKLRLHHTYFPSDKLISISNINKSDIVHGYDFYREGSAPYVFQKYGEDITNFSLSYTNYVGAIVSTPADINFFIHALYTPSLLLNQYQIEKLTTLISKKTGRKFNPQKNINQIGYGLGIFGFYSQENNSMVYFYQGATNGFNFVYFYVPKTGLYLTIGINSITDKINYIDYKKTLDELNALCEKEY